MEGGKVGGASRGAPLSTRPLSLCPPSLQHGGLRRGRLPLPRMQVSNAPARAPLRATLCARLATSAALAAGLSHRLSARSLPPIPITRACPIHPAVPSTDLRVSPRSNPLVSTVCGVTRDAVTLRSASTATLVWCVTAASVWACALTAVSALLFLKWAGCTTLPHGGYQEVTARGRDCPCVRAPAHSLAARLRRARLQREAGTDVDGRTGARTR